MTARVPSQVQFCSFLSPRTYTYLKKILTHHKAMPLDHAVMPKLEDQNKIASIAPLVNYTLLLLCHTNLKHHELSFLELLPAFQMLKGNSKLGTEPSSDIHLTTS